MITEVAFSSHANLGQCLGVEHLGYIFSNVFVRLKASHSPGFGFLALKMDKESESTHLLTGCPLGIL